MRHLKRDSAWLSDAFTTDFTTKLVADTFARTQLWSPYPYVGDTLNLVSGITPCPTPPPRGLVICSTTYVFSAHRQTTSSDK